MYILPLLIPRKLTVHVKYIEKNDLVGSNNNSKWTNHNFLVKSIRILIEITRILIDINILVKIKILVEFTRNIESTRIPIIFTKVLINCHVSKKSLFKSYFIRQSLCVTYVYFLSKCYDNSCTQTFRIRLS